MGETSAIFIPIYLYVYILMNKSSPEHLGVLDVWGFWVFSLLFSAFSGLVSFVYFLYA
jgi:hypothetical protein